MELTIISDTHGQAASLGHLSGDVLIHCGDVMSGWGERDIDLTALDRWLASLDFRHILVVGGNHDHGLQRCVEAGFPPLRSATVLEDSGVVIDGVRFYGAPWTPGLPGHAFYLDDADISERWSRIPPDTDVLVTHTPPAGIRDETRRGQSVGCATLSAAVAQVRPRLHCFGHVHASYGWAKRGGTRFANAALYQRVGRPLRAPLRYTLAG